MITIKFKHQGAKTVEYLYQSPVVILKPRVGGTEQLSADLDRTKVKLLRLKVKMSSWFLSCRKRIQI